MPLDRLDGKVTVKTRDQVRDEYCRDYKLRQPDADTSAGSQVFLEASVFADAMMPIYANAEYLGDATSTTTARGKALAQEAQAALGRGPKEAGGAIGYVTVTTAAGGSNVVEGDEVYHKATGLKFEAIVTGPTTNGAQVAIRGVSVGPSTNLAAGTVLHWRSPRPGMSETCVVFQNTDGSGLTGGTLEETDEELNKAIQDRKANPPASGNDAETIDEVEKIPGLAIQKAFIYPATQKAGTKTVAFTMRPDVPGGSRLPNGAQIGIVEARLKDLFPSDDGIFVATLADDPEQPIFKVTWREGTPGFVDSAPWPEYVSPAVRVQASPAPTATTCRVLTTTATTTPAVGQTVGFYNATTRKFVAKRIAAVAVLDVGLEWDLTFATDVPTSDTSFVPSANQIVSPWSDSLNSIVAPVLAYMDRQGPGELYASFDDPGRRKRRFPPPTPETWPSKIENRIVDDLFSVVADAVVVEPAVPHATTVGTPPLLINLHRLTDMGVFKQ